jgi:WD40 repeat protein
MAFRRDGGRLLSRATTFRVQVRETFTGKPVGTTLPSLSLQEWNSAHAFRIAPGDRAMLVGEHNYSVGFSPEGRYIRRTHLWDLSNGQRREVPHAEVPGGGVNAKTWYASMAISRDGRWLTLLDQGRQLRRIELATGQVHTAPLAQLPWEDVVALSPDGRHALTTSAGFELDLFDRLTGQPAGSKFRLPGWPDYLWATKTGALSTPELPSELHGRISMDGRLALSATGDGVQRWDTRIARPRGEPLPHPGVRGFGFSPDGALIWTRSFDKSAKSGELRLWKADTGELLWQQQGKATGDGDPVFSPDGQTLAMAGGTEVQLYHTVSGKWVCPPLVDSAGVFQCAFSPDGKTLVTRSKMEDQSYSDEMYLWEVASGKRLGTPRLINAFRSTGLFSPDGRAMVVIQGKEVHFLSPDTGGPLCPPLVHPNDGVQVVMSADGRLAATMTAFGREAWLWDAGTGRPIGKPLLHTQPVAAMALSPDGTMLFTGANETKPGPGASATGRLWETRTATPVGAPVPLDGTVSQVAWAPDGKRILLVMATGPWPQQTQVIELRPAPQPALGTPGRLALWAQVVTGMELDADGLVQPLDADTWLERRRQLKALDGPPGP